MSLLALANCRLTIAAETIRYCCRIYEWSGLYVPVVHFRNIANVVKEPGPYILGATAESRGLFTAPGDVIPGLLKLMTGSPCGPR
jgi:hypothetical protein